MSYHKYDPHPALKTYVLCYYVWEEEPPIGGCTIESPPAGYPALVFSYRGRYTIENGTYQNLLVPQYCIAGQSTKLYRLHMSEPVGMIGIVFQPAGLSSLFKIPMYEYVDKRIEITDQLGVDMSVLTEQLNEVEESSGKVSLLENFLFEIIKTYEVFSDEIDKAAILIGDAKGLIGIEDLLKKVFMSRRHFERRFFYKVGLSPKYYCRIRRMSYACSVFVGKSKVDWRQFVMKNGFYDQAHFIKEFKEFIGCSPQEYYANNQESNNYLKSK